MDVTYGQAFGLGPTVQALLAALRADRYVVVRGTAGVGKTRLVRELSSQLSVNSVYVDCKGASTEPEIIDRVALACGVPSTHVNQSEAIRTWLHEVQDVVLFIDHADGAIAMTTGLLARWRTASARHTVVLIVRQLPAQDGFRVVTVEPLSNALAAEMLAERAARLGVLPSALDKAALHELADRAGGVPLALEMTAGWMASLGVRGALAFAPPAGQDDPLGESISRSLADLPEPARALIARLAVIDARFDIDHAVALFEGEPQQAIASLRKLVEASLIRPLDGGSGARFELYSPVRYFLAASIPAGAIERHVDIVHAKAAALLHQLSAGRARDALGLFREERRLYTTPALRASPLGRDVARLIVEVALRGESVDFAVDWIRRFIDASGQDIYADVQLIGDFAWVLMRLLGVNDAHTLLDRVPSLSEPSEQAIARVARARAHGIGHDSQRALDFADEACALVADTPGRTLTEAKLTRAQALLAVGRNREGLEVIREAAQLARMFTPTRILHHILVVQADALIALGDIESAAAAVAELARATSDGADPHAWAHTLRLRATVAFAHGEPTTEHLLYDAFTAFEQAGSRLTFGMTYLLVITMWRAGRLQEALAVLDRSFDSLRDLQNRDGVQTLFQSLEICLATLSGSVAPRREFVHATHPDSEHERIAHMALCIARNEPLPAAMPDESFFVREFRQCSAREVKPEPRRATEGQTSISITGEWIARSGTFAPLTHRPNLMRILAVLADARIQMPGRSLESEKLLAAGWPGERVRADAGRQRVRTALATLREFGLKSVLMTTREGWHLATDGTCVVVANPRDAASS